MTFCTGKCHLQAMPKWCSARFNEVTREACSLSVQIVSFSCHFWQNILQNNSLVHPLGSWCHPLRNPESIHWGVLYFAVGFTRVGTDDFSWRYVCDFTRNVLCVLFLYQWTDMLPCLSYNLLPCYLSGDPVSSAYMPLLNPVHQAYQILREQLNRVRV